MIHKVSNKVLIHLLHAESARRRKEYYANYFTHNIEGKPAILQTIVH